MRAIVRALLVGCALMLAAPVVAEDETPGSLQKELYPKYKKAQTEGKDLGVAGEEFKAGQEAMRNGLLDEALEHFKKSKAAWPAQ
jgi:hypothetical protein